MAKTPEEILAAEAGEPDETALELESVSTEDFAAAEEFESASDANDDADRREEMIEMDNDTIDSLVNDSQELSDETVDTDSSDRG